MIKIEETVIGLVRTEYEDNRVYKIYNTKLQMYRVVDTYPMRLRYHVDNHKAKAWASIGALKNHLNLPGRGLLPDDIVVLYVEKVSRYFDSVVPMQDVYYAKTTEAKSW